MSGPAPTGPTSHGHSLPCTGPPACFPQQPPLPVRSHERQVTDSHQLGDSLWESQYPMLPVRSIERQVTASQLLPAHPLPARSQECQVPVSRQPGGSLKEPMSYSLPTLIPFRSPSNGYAATSITTHLLLPPTPPLLLLTSPTQSPSAPILTSDRTPPLTPPSYYSSSSYSAPPSQHLHPPVILLRFPRPLRYSPSDLTTLLSATPSPYLSPLSSLWYSSATLPPSYDLPPLSRTSYSDTACTFAPSLCHSPYLGL
ncbi:uncharacterized protein EI90DRAFT_3128641 [Cantharellus anzutake]|uniref:uncharacterized protein n=1 Tax=Cantharellus anzutake TaxID=1750568 RepID=UPI001905F1FC|nr:uncharacterized protein EI90DRAFT_3128641 [Cantharellus anzutake]KAF8325569.1 hypothetical protein EI90DRAFT_3128641 [Cantharellus anzutake]